MRKNHEPANMGKPKRHTQFSSGNRPVTFKLFLEGRNITISRLQDSIKSHFFAMEFHENHGIPCASPIGTRVDRERDFAPETGMHTIIRALFQVIV